MTIAESILWSPSASELARDLRATLREVRGSDVNRALLWSVVGTSICASDLDLGRVAGWFGQVADPRLAADIRHCVDHLRAMSDADLAAAFEHDVVGQSLRAERRDQGVYFTPQELADFVVLHTLSQKLEAAASVGDVLRLTVCDIAAGAGAFVLPALSLIAARLRTLSGPSLTAAEARALALKHCVYAVDVDPVAVAVLRTLVSRGLDGCEVEPDLLEQHLVVGDAVLGPIPQTTAMFEADSGFDWSARFPAVFDAGGFDVVIGNPPWGTVKPAIREFFGTVDPLALSMQGEALRKYVADRHAVATSEWEAHSASRREYARSLRDGCGYRYQGGGDTEFYRYFVERACQLIKPDGRIGMLVPSALQRADGATDLRGFLLREGTFDLMFDFLNSKRIFDIHGMFRFLVFVWQRGAGGGVQRLNFGLRSVDEANDVLRVGRTTRISVPYLRAVSGEGCVVPELRSERERDVFAEIQTSHPPLGESRPDAWNLRFVRELDMTNDHHRFVEATTELVAASRARTEGALEHPTLGVLLPLYEGRMIHQFDSAAKAYLSGAARSAKWEVLLPGEKRIAPHYYVPDCDASSARSSARYPRAGFCDVTGHANERTVLAAVVPALAVCGNKVPTCRFDSEEPRLHLLWLAFVNSFVVDWLIRRRVSTTLNFFHWKQIAMPRVEPESPLGSHLVQLVEELLGIESSLCAEEQLRERASLRARIDTAVAVAYGLDAEQLAFILEDFPLLDRYQSRSNRRSTVTRDLLLKTFLEGAGVLSANLTDLGIEPDGLPTSLIERVGMAATEGEIAYVPGEVAAVLALGRRGLARAGEDGPTKEARPQTALLMS